MTISFFVSGIPLPQSRPRFSTKNGVMRTYEKPDITAWKETIQVIAMSKLGKLAKNPNIANSPIFLTLEFGLPKPISVKGSNNLAHTKRPDLDNFVKAVCDALTGAGAWKDDSQVYRLYAEKTYSPGDEGVSITIYYESPDELGGIEIGGKNG